jgi:plastocyanin
MLVQAVAVGVVVVGCGGTATHGASGAPVVPLSQFTDLTGKRTVTVAATEMAFRQRYIEISPGTKVVFRNTSGNPHNVLAVDEGAFPDVDTERFMPGDSVSVTFDGTGNYPYYCSLHGTPTAGMNGEIVVKDRS